MLLNTCADLSLVARTDLPLNLLSTELLAEGKILLIPTEWVILYT